MPPSISRGTLHQLVITAGLGGTAQVVSFLGVIAYTRLAPQSVLGSYFLFYALLRIATFLGTTGISTDSTRKVSRSDDAARELGTAIQFLGTVVMGFVVLAVIGHPLLESFVGQMLALALVGLLPVAAYARFSDAVLRGEKKNAQSSGVVVFERVLTYAVGATAMWVGIDPSFALVGGLATGKIGHLASAMALIDLRPSFSSDVEKLTELFETVVYLTVSGFGDLGQQWIDTLLIGALLSPEFVAIYEVAWRLSAAGLVVTNAIDSVLYPRISSQTASGRSESVKHYSQMAFFYATIPMIAIALGGMAIGPPLLETLYGQQYVGGFTTLVVLLVARIPYSISRVATRICHAFDLDREITRASMVAVLVNAFSNLVLITFFGIIGAAVGSLLSYTVGATLKVRLSSDMGNYTPPLRPLIPALVSGGIMYGIVTAGSHSVSLNVVTLLVLVTIGAVTFATALVLLSSKVRTDIRRAVEA